MDKWEELKQSIRYRIGHAKVLAASAAMDEDWEFYTEQQGRVNELKTIMMTMGNLEEDTDGSNTENG